jgi:hypothetical protein
VVRMNFMRWSAAAAAAVLVILAAWLVMRTKTTKNEIKENTGIAKSQPATPKQNETVIDTNKTKTSDNTTQQLASTDKPDNQKGTEKPKQNEAAGELQSNVNEELYHFAKLVEIKHRELKTMAKDEPLLYQQFSGDVNKLDSVYHSLETKLSKNQNSEELLEAMIQNLQLQMQLLNHQLGIIKQLNNSKKSAYEKAYQSI